MPLAGQPGEAQVLGCTGLGVTLVPDPGRKGDDQDQAKGQILQVARSNPDSPAAATGRQALDTVLYSSESHHLIHVSDTVSVLFVGIQ